MVIMNVTSRVKGCSQRLYNKVRTKTNSSVLNGRSYRQSEKKKQSSKLIVTLPVKKYSAVMEAEML
jgi:hypothetical protein